MKYLRDLGFSEDELQPNHWLNGDYELYQDHEGEFIFSSFESGELEIVKQEANLWLFKPFLFEFFKREHREKRLSHILDKVRIIT